MKRIVMTAIVCLAIGFVVGRYVHWPGFQTPSSQEERKILYYRDPMNPQMTSPLPRKAPDGMDYIPVYADSAPEAPAAERKVAYYKDPMHPWYTSDKPGKAPDCGMDLVPVYADDSGIQGIRIDPATVQNIGVKTEPVARRKLTRTVRTSGVVEFDERRLYSVTTKFMGWVEKLHVDYTGRIVKKGEPLLEIYSPELVSTQEDYLLALRYRDKMSGSDQEEVRRQADELVLGARRRLENWDIPDAEITALEQRGKPRRALTIPSPANGIVSEKMVTEGQQVMAGMPLYKIADLSSVWVTADIYQHELGWIRIGQKADLELTYLPDTSLKGKITYIYPYLNVETRTAKVRIEVRNTGDFTLKPGMFATVKIVSAVAVETVAVPEEALIRTCERNVAIIALGGGYFEPR